MSIGLFIGLHGMKMTKTFDANCITVVGIVSLFPKLRYL